MTNKFIKPFHFLEDSALVVLTLTTIGLGAAQIILRNSGVTGLVWMDPAARVAVLWLAMFGALRASREQKHIVIDLLSHYSKPSIRKITFFIVSIATAAICFFAAYYSFAFVWDEYDSGKLYGYEMAFLNVPVWFCEAIIPVTLALVGLRSLVHCTKPPELNDEGTSL